jgi:hypothetical protein
MIDFSVDERPVLKVVFDAKKNEKEIEDEELIAEVFIGVKSYKAKGKRLSNFVIKKVTWLEPLEPLTPEPQTEEPDLEDDVADGSEEIVEAEEPAAEAKSAETIANENEVSDNDPPIVPSKMNEEKIEGQPLKKPSKPKKKPGEEDSSQMSLF